MAELSEPPPASPAPAGQAPADSPPARDPHDTATGSPHGGVTGDRQVNMAAERTWLAWWRTALVATAGALAVGRATPRLLHVASWPYVLLGVGYGVLAIGMLLAGAYRQRGLHRAAENGEDRPVNFTLVSAFTAGGVLLTCGTIALVLAQS
jgi:inner membrane protein YidH